MTDAVGALKDPSLDDYAREKAAQSAGLQLIRSAVSILLRCAAAFLLASLPFLATDFLGIIPQDQALAFLARWDVIAYTTVGTIVIWFVGSRVWPTQ
ncbi:MAG: hypothetical protein ABJH85_00450 [Paracoccaceae bacterium]